VLKSHAIAQFETTYVRRLLAENDVNISKAARSAKKNRRAFWQLMRKHEIVALDVASMQTGYHRDRPLLRAVESKQSAPVKKNSSFSVTRKFHFDY
jgi:hypothetical protein